MNAGFLLVKRWDDGDLAFIECIVTNLDHAGIDVYHHWAEQLMYGLFASRHRVSHALPESRQLTSAPLVATRSCDTMSASLRFARASGLEVSRCKTSVRQ